MYEVVEGEKVTDNWTTSLPRTSRVVHAGHYHVAHYIISSEIAVIWSYNYIASFQEFRGRSMFRCFTWEQGSCLVRIDTVLAMWKNALSVSIRGGVFDLKIQRTSFQKINTEVPKTPNCNLCTTFSPNVTHRSSILQSWNDHQSPCQLQ